jgi:predicted acyltransferase
MPHTTSQPVPPAWLPNGESGPASARAAAPRLASLDALRGFDMFWIVGGEEIIHALYQISDTGAVRFLAEQMDHKPWQGFAFYDLIFPLFVFIVGVALVFSLAKTIRQEGRGAAVRRLLRRTLLLFLLGIISYGGLSSSVEKIRLLGVLQRIALCYLFAGLAFCFLKTRGQVVLCVALLVGYWALMTFVPVPGVGAGSFWEGKNLANYLDEQYLPWRKWDGTHDPEGLLSTLPAIATCLLGVFAGTLLKNASVSDGKKVLWLTGAGITLAALGWLWNEQFPVIKKIWTSSYVLVAGGYSCLLLAAFFLVVDVWKFQKWAQPFIWIGVNPITIYMAHNLVDFNAIARRFVGGDVNQLLGRYGQLAIAAVVVAMTFGLCYFLYRRKIFLRL